MLIFKWRSCRLVKVCSNLKRLDLSNIVDVSDASILQVQHASSVGMLQGRLVIATLLFADVPLLHQFAKAQTAQLWKHFGQVSSLAIPKRDSADRPRLATLFGHFQHDCIQGEYSRRVDRCPRVQPMLRLDVFAASPCAQMAQTCTTITVLKLDECMLVDDKALLFVSATLTELTELSLNNCPQVRHSLQRRIRMQSLPTLIPCAAVTRSKGESAGDVGFGRGHCRQMRSAAYTSPWWLAAAHGPRNPKTWEARPSV